MTYTTPKTWVTGEAWMASDLNRQLRDNLEAVRLPLVCNVSATAGQTIPTNAGEGFTAINMVDVLAESVFLDANHTTRLVVPDGYDGYYWIHGGVTYSTNTSGTRRDANLRLNGTISIAKNRVSPPPTGSGGSQAARCEVACLVRLVAGDYIELGGNQDSGSAMAITTGTDATFLEMLRRRL